MDRYRPPHSDLWQGREDEGPHQRLFQAVTLVDLNLEIPYATLKTYALIGFACDEGIKRNKGRTGAAEGPNAIRQALAKQPFSHPTIALWDAGNIVCLDNDLEKSQETLAKAVALLLSKNCIPLVIGGGHELAWGHYLGIKQANQHANLHLVNFDAHYDLRPLGQDRQANSGTPFWQIAADRKAENLPFSYSCVGIQPQSNTQALHTLAKNYHVDTIFAEDMHLDMQQTADQLSKIINRSEPLLLSLCMDVFAAPYAPGVSAPQPFGITPWQILPLLKILKTSEKIFTIEIAEVSPPLDFHHSTSLLAAQLIIFIIT